MSLIRQSNIIRLTPIKDCVNTGGSHKNTYFTLQSAYEAALVLYSQINGKVIIQVGNTSAAEVGDLLLSANYNPNIVLCGISNVLSEIGNILVNNPTFTVNIQLKNIKIGNITTEGNVTFTSCEDVVVGNILCTSATTNSGSIALTNCKYCVFGTITNNATLGNVGSISLTKCTGCEFGAIASNQLSTVASYNIGAFSNSNCTNILYNTYTATLNYVNGTGSHSGFTIASNSSDIKFTGAVTIRMYGVGTNITRLDAYLGTFTVSNTTFSARVSLNTTSPSQPNRTGGGVRTININNCLLSDFLCNISVLTPYTNNNCYIRNSQFNKISIYTENTSFLNFKLANLTGNHINTSTLEIWDNTDLDNFTTMPFTTGVNSAELINITYSQIYCYLIGHEVATGIEDVVISGVDLRKNSEFYSYHNQLNFVFINTNFKKYDNVLNSNYFSVGSQNTGMVNQVANTKAHKFFNCNIEFFDTSYSLSPIAMEVKNSYFGFLETISNKTLDIICNNSEINLKDCGAFEMILNGTATTSTIRKKNVSTNNMTNNNSFYESVA